METQKKKKITYCFSLPRFLTSRWKNCFQLQACCFPTGYKSPVAFQPRSKYFMFSHQGKSSGPARHQTLVGPSFCLPVGWQPRQLTRFCKPSRSWILEPLFVLRSAEKEGAAEVCLPGKKRWAENSIAVLPGSVTLDSNKVTACK